MDTSEIEAVVARPAKRSWRRHSEDFKARVIALARQPQASVAAVALANGLNANMLRRWVRESENASKNAPALPTAVLVPSPAFVQLPMTPERAVPAAGADTVEVKIHRRDAQVVVSLPLNSASASWLREVLG